MAGRPETEVAARFSPTPSAVRRWRLLAAPLVVSIAAALAPGLLRADQLDEMSLDRWAKLREVERYQLKIAEKYYREKDYKVAAAEYEKFLTLYESSEGAPHAQLKWSLCLVQRRKLNTAIKDGFQSVIDYWPDSPDAVAAGYFIGKTYKDMGEIRAAKKAYAELISKHAKHQVSAFARNDLLAIVRAEGDQTRLVALLRELTYDTQRVRETARVCQNASRQLATHYFMTGAFNEGRDALATTYKTTDLPPQVVSHISRPISDLTAQTETKAKGEKLADQAIAWLREQMPTDLKDEAQAAIARRDWFYTADVQGASRRADDVPKIYDQMVKVFGVDDDILGRLAGWYKSQDRRGEARATYRRFKNQINGLAQVALMCREEKKYPEAVALYRQLVGLDQEQPTRWGDLIGTTYREARKPDEAVAAYQELIASDPDHVGRWQWNIAVTYREFNRYKEAIGVFRQCENFPENYKQMAWCHLRLKEYNEALVLYHQVLGGHEPSAPWAQLQIGYTYRSAGQKEKAIKSLQRVCDKYPKSGQASEAHAFLQREYKINYTKGGGTAGADE